MLQQADVEDWDIHNVTNGTIIPIKEEYSKMIPNLNILSTIMIAIRIFGEELERS